MENNEANLKILVVNHTYYGNLGNILKYYNYFIETQISGIYNLWDNYKLWNSHS